MNKRTAAKWFSHQPRWLRTLVYELTGWQVQRMTIWRNGIVQSDNYSWSKARRLT